MKKAKVDSAETEEFSSSSNLKVYSHHNDKLLSDYTSGKWSVSSLSFLMEETFSERRKDLKANLPVTEALEKFLWLKEPSLVCFK